MKSEPQYRKPLLWIGIIVVGVAMAVAATIKPSGLNAMADQSNSTEEKLAVKVTFLGEQDKPLSTLLFTASTISEPMALFEELGLVHSNDRFGVIEMLIENSALSDLVAQSRLSLSEPVLADEESAQLAISIIQLASNSYEGGIMGAPAAAKYLSAIVDNITDEETQNQFEAWRARTNLTSD